MLQTFGVPSNMVEAGEPPLGFPQLSGQSPADLFATIVGFVRRQWLVVLSGLPLTVALAGVYLYTTPAVYTGQARILINTGKVDIFQKSILFGVDPVSNSMMDSQVEILKSENFARSVIKKLNLAQDPEFVGSDTGTLGRVLNLLLHPSALTHTNQSIDTNQLADESMLRALSVFENRLTVTRVGMSYVIEIGFRSVDPDRAVEIANAVADGFITDQLDARYQTIRGTTDWLQDRLNELRGQVSAADHAVVEYRSTHDIVGAGGHLANEQQLTELNSAVVKARTETAEAKARLDQISKILSNNEFNPADLSTVAEALHNEIISKLRQQYLDLAQRASLFESRLGRDHLAVVNIRNQMREIRRSMIDELNRIAQADKSDYAIARERQNSVEKSYATAVAGSHTTNKAEVELRQLESAAQTYRALHDGFQQRYMDSIQQQSFPEADARVITRASTSAKTSPKSLLILAAAIVGGLVLGLAIAALREISDRKFRRTSEVEARLKTECLALVPKIKSSGKISLARTDPLTDTSGIVGRDGGSRNIPLGGGLCRGVVDSPLSRFAESIRAVKSGADLSRVAKSNKVMGITSSLPNEGKSTIASALAQLSAFSGARVVLVDCDLRQPSLTKELAPAATAGLIEILTGSANLEDVIWTDPSTKLAFLPVVAKSRLSHTSDILASDALKRLFDELRGKYDYVIVDLSPLAPVVDVRSTANLVDCYVLVIEWGKTKIDVVEHALSSARGVYDNLLGVVLNKVDLKGLSRYESHGSDYYYNRYYAQYGYTD
jgi:succinoglycan biosynthesis transport protein ExoP